MWQLRDLAIHSSVVKCVPEPGTLLPGRWGSGDNLLPAAARPCSTTHYLGHPMATMPRTSGWSPWTTWIELPLNPAAKDTYPYGDPYQPARDMLDYGLVYLDYPGLRTWSSTEYSLAFRLPVDY